MKFEPLKGKTSEVMAWSLQQRFAVYSAAEWLKEQIPNICVDLLSTDEERISKKIDEAFGEVAKMPKPSKDGKYCPKCGDYIGTCGGWSCHCDIEDMKKESKT